MSTWRRSPRLTALRGRLRAEYDRPARRWSELAVTCMTVAEPDRRTPSERLSELAQRQTHLLYES
ncbi:MAG TPA: hypothetical protein VFK41_11865 [Nocardioidaceae bacterium]|nr:hypothetical protein [Nocardioidaceae bacterium]